MANIATINRNIPADTDQASSLGNVIRQFKGDVQDTFPDFDGSVPVRVTEADINRLANADTASTPNTLVLRDSTGNVIGNIDGNAATATALQSAVSIAGNSFDGTSDITIQITDLDGVVRVSNIDLNTLADIASNVDIQTHRTIGAVLNILQQRIDTKANTRDVPIAADDEETRAGIDSAKFVTPSSLAAKLPTPTSSDVSERRSLVPNLDGGYHFVDNRHVSNATGTGSTRFTLTTDTANFDEIQILAARPQRGGGEYYVVVNFPLEWFSELGSQDRVVVGGGTANQTSGEYLMNYNNTNRQIQIVDPEGAALAFVRVRYLRYS